MLTEVDKKKIDFLNQYYSEGNITNEEKMLLSSKKETLSEILNDIIDKIDEEDNDSLYDFIMKKKLKSILVKRDIPLNKNRIILYIKIKILGTLFVTFHFIAIFLLIGLMQALKDELYYSIRLILYEEEKTLDFYENYNKIYMQIPEFSFFYISSFFAGSLIELLGFSPCFIIIFLINLLTIFIGIKSIEFHTGEDVNKRYSVNQLAFIFFNFFILNLGTGIIISFPNEKLITGFNLYDLYIDSKENNINNTLDRQIMTVLNDMKNIQSKHDNNGYIFYYIFSIIGSSITTIIINKFFIINKDIDKFYQNIILFYFIFTVLSIIIYCIIYNDLTDISEKNEDESEVNIFQFLGYLYYSEKYPDKEKIRIIYKLKGIFSWLCTLIFKNDFIIFSALIIIVFEINNIGFNSLMSEYFDNNQDLNKTKMFIIFIISYVAIVFYYCLNMLIGCFRKKKPGNKKYINEFEIILDGLWAVIYIGLIYSSLISILVYYNKLTDNMHYFIIISNKCTEYIKLIFFLAIDDELFEKLNLELISLNSIISIYLFLYDLIIFILDLIFNIKIETLILIQFIFGIFCCVMMTLIFCCGWFGCGNKREKEIQEKLIEQKKKVVSEIEKLLKDANILNENEEINNQMIPNDKNDYDYENNAINEN